MALVLAVLISWWMLWPLVLEQTWWGLMLVCWLILMALVLAVLIWMRMLKVLALERTWWELVLV